MADDLADTPPGLSRADLALEPDPIDVGSALRAPEAPPWQSAMDAKLEYVGGDSDNFNTMDFQMIMSSFGKELQACDEFLAGIMAGDQAFTGSRGSLIPNLPYSNSFNKNMECDYESLMQGIVAEPPMNVLINPGLASILSPDVTQLTSSASDAVGDNQWLANSSNFLLAAAGGNYNVYDPSKDFIELVAGPIDTMLYLERMKRNIYSAAADQYRSIINYNDGSTTTTSQELVDDLQQLQHHHEHALPNDVDVEDDQQHIRPAGLMTYSSTSRSCTTLMAAPYSSSSSNVLAGGGGAAAAVEVASYACTVPHFGSDGCRIAGVEFRRHSNVEEDTSATVEDRLRSLCSQIRQHWSQLFCISLVHRIGMVGAGEVSAVMVVSGPDFVEALNALQFAVEKLRHDEILNHSEIVEMLAFQEQL